MLKQFVPERQKRTIPTYGMVARWGDSERHRRIRMVLYTWQVSVFLSGLSGDQGCLSDSSLTQYTKRATKNADEILSDASHDNL